MITIRKRTERGLVTLEELAPGSWVDVLDPTTDEVLYLQRELGIPQDFLTNPLDTDEQARTEKEDDALLIVLRVPAFQGENVDIPYVTSPLGIVLTDKGVMTVCGSENCVTEELIGGRIKGLSTVKRNRFVLHLMQITAKKYLTYLRDINRMTEQLEDKLQLSLRNREVMELLKYQKSLVYFTTALKIQRADDAAAAEEPALPACTRTTRICWKTCVTEIQQAIEMTNISSNILSADDGRLRLDHLEQPQRRDEVPGGHHDRPESPHHGRHLLRHERPPAVRSRTRWPSCSSWGSPSAFPARCCSSSGRRTGCNPRPRAHHDAVRYRLTSGTGQGHSPSP